MRNGWRAPMMLKAPTILPSWPCTSCRLNAGGLHGCTSCGGSWSPHTPARSQQFPPTSKKIPFFFFFSLLNKDTKLCICNSDFQYNRSGVYISSVSVVPPLRLTDKTPKEYAVYRSPLLFWGLVDLVYDMFRVSVSFTATLPILYYFSIF